MKAAKKNVTKSSKKKEIDASGRSMIKAVRKKGIESAGEKMMKALFKKGIATTNEKAMKWRWEKPVKIGHASSTDATRKVFGLSHKRAARIDRIVEEIVEGA